MGRHNNWPWSWWGKEFGSPPCWGPQRHFSLKFRHGIHNLFSKRWMMVAGMVVYGMCLLILEKNYPKALAYRHNTPNTLKGRKNRVKCRTGVNWMWQPSCQQEVWSATGSPDHGATPLPYASNVTLLWTRYFGSQFCQEVLSWKLSTHFPTSGIKVETLREVSGYNLISSKFYSQKTGL